MKKENLLSIKRPDLVKEWHPTKNDNLTPSDVTFGSKRKVWWACKKGHEWETTVSSRTSGRNCPYCAGKKVCMENCLETINPEVSKEWNFDKNKPLTPKDVFANSNKKAWWKCEKGHEWKAVISSRKDGAGCPYCANKIVDKDNCLESVYPKIAKEWHPTKNGNLTPEDVVFASTKRIWWVCEKGHEWNISIQARSLGRGCPYCSGNLVCTDNSLSTLEPSIAKEWHPTKNGDLTPLKVSKSSRKNVWWLCRKGHAWNTTIQSRVRQNTNCPYCTGRKADKDNSLASLNPELTKEWHPTKNGNVTPLSVTPTMSKKVWWLCNKGHEWEAVIGSRNKGSSCPYCINKFVCDDNSLASLDPELAKEWHPKKNKGLTPKDVTKGSEKKVWWRCNKGHEWKVSIKNRTKGHNCPKCNAGFQTSFPEQTIFFYLREIFPNIKNRFILTYNESNFEVDLFIPNLKLAIEYDGHFYHLNRTMQDEHKNRLCLNKGIDLLRLRERNCPKIKKYGATFLEYDYEREYNNIHSIIYEVLKHIKDNYALSKSTLRKINNLNIDLDNDRKTIYSAYKVDRGERSLKNKRPDIALQWDYDKNNNLTPNNVTFGSNLTVWWKCDCHHSWQARILDRTKSKKVYCPNCKKTNEEKEVQKDRVPSILLTV